MSLERRSFIHPKPVESQKPERLSLEQIAGLLAGLGNSESKAITFLALAEAKRPLTLMGLHNELMDVQGKGGWKIDHTTPFSYCTNSLAPIGCVAKGVVNEERRIYGYEITPHGEKIGVPFAGLLLDWSLRYPEFSLRQIFGGTHSSGKTRSPGTVFQILASISTREQPIRLTDVAADIGKKEESENIAKHLFELSRGGIIIYQTSQATVEGKRPVVFYSLQENKLGKEMLPIYQTYKTLTHDVYEVCKEHVAASLSAQDVMKLLIKKNQNYSQLKPKLFRPLMSGILHFLSEKGYLINTTDFSAAKKTDISLNGKQRQALTDLVNIILAFQKQDPTIIDLGKKRAREILHDQESVSQLMRKAKEYSPYAQKRHREETVIHIRKILQHKSEEMTVGEIQKVLEKQYGIKLSRMAMYGILKIILTNEKFSIYKVGNNYVYKKLQ